MSTENPRQRPFKVWNADRSTRKGVIASNLADLIRKGKVKLDIQEGESVAVVLEADGTEVDDDYFKRLEENTVFLLLKLGERWFPPGVEAIRAAIHAIPRIVCDAIHTLELIDEAPSWKIMDNRGRVTVVLHWDQRDIRRLSLSGRGNTKDGDVPTIEEPPGAQSTDGAHTPLSERRSPILVTARVGSLGGVGERVTVVPALVKRSSTDGQQPQRGSPDLAGGAVCDFHCCALHEEGGRIHVNKSVATSPIQEQQPGGTTASESVRRPSPKGGAHVRFLDVHVEQPTPHALHQPPILAAHEQQQQQRESSESDTENTANEDEQLSERYLLLVDQLSVEQKRHLSIKDIGIILERLSSKIVDVERLEREKESDDVHNWTIKATIKGEVLREIGVVYNGHYYGISEHPGYF